MADATGPYGLPLPGYAIPYALNDAEKQDFLNAYSTDPVVSNYLWTKKPPYGVIFRPPSYGQILLWFDASGVLHIIDVTNLSIVGQVEIPDTSDPGVIDVAMEYVQNFVDQVQNVVGGLPSAAQALSAIEIVAAAVGLYFVYQIFRK